MSREYRPYYIKKATARAHELYAEHFLKPKFEQVGRGATFVSPWNIEVFGPSIRIGKYVNVVAAPGKKTSIIVWPLKKNTQGISINDYTIISPSARISAAHEISIGKNCMIANGVYITDCDWHGLVDRVFSFGKPMAVTLEENVWVGDSSIICKGVTIGKNSIIGAGSVVRSDIPSDSIVVGNPAKVVKQLDPQTSYITREQMFANPDEFINNLNELDKLMLHQNTLLGWLRHKLFPKNGD